MIGGGLKTRWERLGDIAFPTLGYPKANERTVELYGQQLTLQEFERGVLGWYPVSVADGVPPESPWHVRDLKMEEIKQMS